MKPFHCDQCGALLAFENVSCLKCGRSLGFVPEGLDLSTLEAASGGDFRALSPAARGGQFRRCANGVQHEVCNWLVAAEDPNPFCRSCRLNEVIPDLTVAGNRERWLLLEQAKRRLVYTLLWLDLPLKGVPAESRPDLRFRFVGDVPGAAPLLTGHENGIITLNIAEADPVERERRRVSLHEPLRTLPAHFRHEVAHYYWDRLVANSSWLGRFREIFGDETADYSAALERYYHEGPRPDWPKLGVSAYASAHPWEDWAETWAHYLHVVDALETAAGFGLSLKPRDPAGELPKADPAAVAQPGGNFDSLLAHWLPLTFALNSINRGIGLPDFYPFILAPVAVEKLRFVHDVIAGSRVGTGKIVPLEHHEHNAVAHHVDTTKRGEDCRPPGRLPSETNPG